jgi:3-methyladenine DNA glycosylase Tag
MRSFDEIFEMAAGRKGGAEALESLLSKPKSAQALAMIGDDRWLSGMTKTVFQAGFNWKVIESKWADFEIVFEGFEPARWSMMSDDDFDRLVKDSRIVRHAKKILSVRDNAIFLRALAEEQGSAAKVFAAWPSEDYVGLLELLKKRGSRLGGTTAQYFLRRIGKDSFILSRDVTAALLREGVVDKAPSSKSALGAVQKAFNAWREESGRSLVEISRVLALSVDS